MTYTFEKEFNADVQYNDLIGSTAADNNSASKWLKENGHINDGEFVVGMTMNIPENHTKRIEDVTVNFFISALNGYSSVPEMLKNTDNPILVSNIDVSMNVRDFFGLFKRFELTLSNKGLLENRTLSCR